jgi:hydrogenase-4 component E
VKMPNSLLANVPTPPSTFDGVTEAIAVFVLLVVFVMLRQALLHSQVRLYALQSLAVSVLAGVLGFSEHASDLFVLAGLSFVLKVIVVPLVVLHLLSEAEVDLAGSHRRLSNHSCRVLASSLPRGRTATGRSAADRAASH